MTRETTENFDSRSRNEVSTQYLAENVKGTIFGPKTVSNCRNSCRVCPALHDMDNFLTQGIE